MNQTSIQTKQPRRYPIPIESIIEYKNKGLTHQEVADLVGCTKGNVTQRLQAAGYNPDALSHYKRHKADVIDFKASQCLNGITLDKIKESSAYQLTGMYGILNQHSRLERGESTNNVALVIGNVMAIKAKEQGQSGVPAPNSDSNVIDVRPIGALDTAPPGDTE